MRLIFSRLVARFSATTAECLLVLGVSIAAVFGAAFMLTARYEHVLTIEDGVGLLENYGLIAALFSDAVLFFLTKKYLDCCFLVANTAPFRQNLTVREAKLSLFRECRLQTERRFAYFFFFMLGCLALTGNISLHIFDDVQNHWNGDVFDSLRHPYSFSLNKIFSFYSWCIVFPICGYIALTSTLQIYRMVGAVEKDCGIGYDLLHPDNAGGFASIRLAIAYFNIGIALIYLQIALYTVTFHGINIAQAGAYALTTIAFLIANLAIFGRIDRIIEKKKQSALNEVKARAYDGDITNFEIFRYYLDVFSKRSLRRRLTYAILTLKSVAIAIPPIVKGLHLITS